MVGRVIYKNFETGSYENMRITVYEGTSYADIERQREFFSCLVNITSGKVTYDFVTSDKVRLAYLGTIRKIASEARRYLFANTHVTIAEFVFGVGEVTLRDVSSKSGVYSPPDLRAVFDKRVADVYKLCSRTDEMSHTVRSIVCDLVNHAVANVFDSEDKLFFVSGKGIYINAALFVHSPAAMDVLDLAPDIRPLIKTKRSKRHMLSLRPVPYEPKTLKRASVPDARYALVYARRASLARVCAYVSERAQRLGSDADTTRFIISLVTDEYILSVADNFALELAEATRIYEFCFAAKSHTNYLTASDVLELYAGVTKPSALSARVAAQSADMKLRDKLPCPPYYDSYGRAYW